MSSPPVPLSDVSFTLNGSSVVVRNASPLLSLNEWLHSQPGLRGTKRMCAEGGCGCCVVTAVRTDPLSGKEGPIAINSVRHELPVKHMWL